MSENRSTAGRGKGLDPSWTPVLGFDIVGNVFSRTQEKLLLLFLFVSFVFFLLF